MPRIIRQALGERFRHNGELQKFLGHFRAATGVAVEFVCALGNAEGEGCCDRSPLCARLMRDPTGRTVCSRFRQRLLEAADTQPATSTCESGVAESAVPMRAGGQTVGYLVTGGYLAAPADRPRVNRARHLLSRSGMEIGESELLALSARMPVIPPERQEALVQLLKLAAEHLTARFTERLTAPETRMPALVERACRMVHADFAHAIAMPDIARRLGVSEGHLSRTFHHSTGLRFVEYVARFRADRARELLQQSTQPVIEIAFACGFQSLSQFNRVLRAQFGMKPSGMRQAQLEKG